MNKKGAKIFELLTVLDFMFKCTGRVKITIIKITITIIVMFLRYQSFCNLLQVFSEKTANDFKYDPVPKTI